LPIGSGPNRGRAPDPADLGLAEVAQRDRRLSLDERARAEQATRFVIGESDRQPAPERPGAGLWIVAEAIVTSAVVD
jgi:hypothetical protein